MKITDSPDELAACLANSEGLIVFDGCTGAGKSTLMHDMAARLGCDAIEVDCFINKHQAAYVDALRADALRDRISQGFVRFPLVLLDGVCARAIVERLSVPGNVFVYVQRISRAGIPGDLSMVDAEEDGVADGPPYLSNLDKKILCYHAMYTPISRADVLYRRTER